MRLPHSHSNLRVGPLHQRFESPAGAALLPCVFRGGRFLPKLGRSLDQRGSGPFFMHRLNSS